MSKSLATRGLILEEPLLWERGERDKSGFSPVERDVEDAPLDGSLMAPVPEIPGLSEPELVRHYTRLSTWNFGVDTGMYPLGSCTMKYNPKVNELLAGLDGISQVHPLLPNELCQGALRIMHELEGLLAEITGMDSVTLQPAAGAHGELCGMLIIHAYHHDRGRSPSKIIVPDTAHGTNPASAALCGFRPVRVEVGHEGILTAGDVASVLDEDTAGIMLTNPNTLGLFEENIVEIAQLVHEKGGLVYCDGANMNALMGIVDISDMGVDILHLNLHKTFSTPHGGGGPGAGPVCVTEDLAPYLPVPRIVKKGGLYALSEDFPKSIGRLHGFYGNFSVMVKAYAYILSMGADGLRKASQLAVLNANYIKECLKDVYHLPYDRPCLHECVFTDKLQRAHKVTTLDIAKRLMDYGFHPPTIYFPLLVSGAIMIEPTETESKGELDLFIEAMRAIACEARERPEKLTEAPFTPKLRRLDEVQAARHPRLCG